MASVTKLRFSKTESIKYAFKKTLYRSQCSSSYKSTLLLPRTKFPHKIGSSNRRERDRLIESQAKFEDLYNSQQKLNTASSFILHDGPPYANGDVHIGHAVNKILKDVTVRHHLLNGEKVHFMPGWDCHGLPIELKVLKENDSDVLKDAKLNVRKRAYSFSQKTKKKQMDSFMEWGLLADWKNSYITCNSNYIVQQLKLFQDLHDKGIIFRDYKPVYWSPKNRTSLAEAELDYCSNHVSPSIYVKFKVCRCPDFIKDAIDAGSKLHVVIWTTTPWTLVANQAVCFSSNKNYCVASCKSKNELYLLAEETLPFLENVLKTELQVLKSFEGSLLKDVTYFHPIIQNRECPLLTAHHVTMEKGTGLVHMAPNHGFDDYIVAQKQNIPLDPCLVNEDGCYTHESGKEFEGKFVMKEGTAYILELIKNDILQVDNYVHSYPYDWRSKTPVIIRSCYQWFIDVHQIRHKAIACLQDVNVIPEHFKKALQNQIESSPQWCISRQRSWGVPIPAFYSSDSNKPIIHRLLTENLCSLIKSNGIHSWWELNSEQLLPSNIKKQLNLKENGDYKKSYDIMDIWLDSGFSWRCALPDPHISDLVLEGIDQIRGWFYSSLLTSVAIRGKAPYKSIFLHGFTTDSEGRKMSKSEGNVISPSDILSGIKRNNMPPYGIDVLRWWVAAHACHSENTPIKSQIMEECSQNINKFRNVFKFLLGNLDNFDMMCIEDASEMRSLDLFMLHKVLQFSKRINQLYKSMQYKNVAKEVVNFITNDVSSFYCALVKDRLYCDDVTSKERLHCQAVLNMTLNTLIQSIAPICPHLANEVLLHHPNKELAEQNVFLAKFPCLSSFLGITSFPDFMEAAKEIRNAILKSETKISNPQIIIACSPTISDNLQKLNMNLTNNSGLVEFYQSDVYVNELPQSTKKELSTLNGKIENLGEDGKFSVTLAESKFDTCPRCRLYKSNSPNSLLCQRCEHVINYKSSRAIM